MTPRFFTSFILVNIFKILTNLFLTFIPFFRKTSAIAAATLDGMDADMDADDEYGFDEITSETIEEWDQMEREAFQGEHNSYV